MSADLIVAIFATIGYFTFIYFTQKSKTFENYSVADRSVGFFLLFASLSANFIGPGFTLGLTQKGYTTGYFYLFVAGAYGIGKVFEGYFIAPKLREKFSNALSIGDVVGGNKGHNNKLLKFLVGMISFGLLIGLSIVMSKAAGEVLNNFLGIPKILGTTIVTLIVTSYSVFGGLKSTMMTDALQFITFMIILPFLAIIVLFHHDFSLTLFAHNAEILTKKGFDENSKISILGMFLTWGLGEMLMPFTVNTILAGKSSKVAKRALSFSGLLMFLWLFLMLTLGILSKTVLIGVNDSDQILLDLGKNFYKSGFFGLFTVAIIGVIMSSQDALINCASVVFVQDMISVVKPLQEKNIFKFSKIAGIIVGFLSILLASFIPSIIDGLMLFYGIWVPSVLVVTIFSIFLEKPSYIPALISLFVGIISTILWSLTKWNNTIPSIFSGTILSISAYLLTYFIVKKLKVSIFE